MSRKQKQRPWQKRGYAVGLAESIELAVSRGHQCVSLMTAWIAAEWGTFYGPSVRKVARARAELRRQGYITYSRSEGWRTAPAYGPR